jgi:hypothetical protein
MTDTSVKSLNSDQTGAPTIANVAGNMIAFLDAVLINGYGSLNASSGVIASGVCTLTFGSTHSFTVDSVVLVSGVTNATTLNAEQKVTAISSTSISFMTALADQALTGSIAAKFAPLGWSKVFSGTNLAVYQSANVAASGALLRVDDTTTTYCTVRGYAAMTDISTGTDIFPTVAQQSISYWWKADSATTKPWFVYGNDRFFYFGVAPLSSYPAANVIFGFGDYIARKSGDGFRSLLAMSTTVPAASGSSAYQPIPTTSASYGYTYSPRSYTALGSPVSLTREWYGASAQSTGSGSGGKAWPNGPDNGSIYTPIELLEGTHIRGELPGILATPQAINTNIIDNTRMTNTTSGRVLVYRQFGNGVGGVFFDITGPWGSN